MTDYDAARERVYALEEELEALKLASGVVVDECAFELVELRTRYTHLRDLVVALLDAQHYYARHSISDAARLGRARADLVRFLGYAPPPPKTEGAWWHAWLRMWRKIGARCMTRVHGPGWKVRR